MNETQNRWLVSDLEEDEKTTTRSLVSDDTPIVRYVRLSTFLLYLSKRVFIPSLRLLQKVDPLEGRLPETVFQPGYGTQLEPHLRFHEDWLLEQARGSKLALEPGNPRTHDELNFLAKIWLNELARRRCVWCWNVYEGESHAMWSLYGAKGIAILSSVGRVKLAIEKAGPFRCLIAPVRYPLARRTFFAGENGEPTGRMVKGKNLMRPYLYKNPTYRYEEEIRFVFGTHHDLVQEDSTYAASSPKGVVIEVKPQILIDGIHVSPDIPEDEFRLVGSLFWAVGRETIKFPDYPNLNAQQWEQRYATMGGTPFTTKEDPAELFPDLEI
jgi:hypothetical protein